MDGDNGFNMRNWGYYEPISLKGHLGLQLMLSMPEKSLLGTLTPAAMDGMNAAYHYRDIGASQVTYPMDYVRDVLISQNQREKYFSMIAEHPSCSVIPETSSAPHTPMVQPHDLSKEGRTAEEVAVEKSNKKRLGIKMSKSPKEKKPKRGPRDTKADKTSAVQRARSVKKTAEIKINGIGLDISSIPIPVCSCTGTPQQSYRWGSGGWQSACCTSGMSMYPLPMSTKRRGARIAGRKMSIGAFKKVLEQLASQGYDFSNPIDLRTHWAKHGTNKFVTIR